MDDALERLVESLTNHTPDAAGLEYIDDIRTAAKLLGTAIIGACPHSRERSLAVTHLEESVMWAVKSIVLPRHGD